MAAVKSIRARLKPVAPVLLLSLALAGCATCRRHPDGCAIAAAVIGGAAIVAVGAAQWSSCSSIGPYSRPCHSRRAAP